MTKPIPCRPLWWRIPRAVIVALLLTAGFALLFTFAPLIELTGGGK